MSCLEARRRTQEEQRASAKPGAAAGDACRVLRRRRRRRDSGRGIPEIGYGFSVALEKGTQNHRLRQSRTDCGSSTATANDTDML